MDEKTRERLSAETYKERADNTTSESYESWPMDYEGMKVLMNLNLQEAVAGTPLSPEEMMDFAVYIKDLLKPVDTGIKFEQTFEELERVISEELKMLQPEIKKMRMQLAMSRH